MILIFQEVFDLNKENEIVIKAIVNSSDNKNKKKKYQIKV